MKSNTIMKGAAIAMLALCTSLRTNAQCIPASDQCLDIKMTDVTLNVCPATTTVYAPTFTATGSTMVPPGLTIVNCNWSPTGAIPYPWISGCFPTTTFTVPAGAPIGCYPMTYTLNAVGPDIIQNGDFSMGNACFMSAYTPAPLVDLMVGSYNVSPTSAGVLSPAWNTYCSPSLAGSPQMLTANGATAGAAGIPPVWMEQLQVCEGSNYVFEMDVASWSGAMATPADYPNLQVLVNGVPIGSAPITTSCVWNHIIYPFTATSTSAFIQIIDLNTGAPFNDFAIKNITCRRHVSSSATVTVCVSAGTPVNLVFEGYPCNCFHFTGAPGCSVCFQFPQTWVFGYLWVETHIYTACITLDGTGNYYLDPFVTQAPPATSTGCYSHGTTLNMTDTWPYPGPSYSPYYLPLGSTWEIGVIKVISISCASPCDYIGIDWAGWKTTNGSNNGVAYNGLSGTGKSAIEDLKLVPNPTSGSFAVRGFLKDKATTDVVYEITDMLGRTVQKVTVAAEHGLINTSFVLDNNIANGTYLMKVNANGASQVMKFSVER